jgi:hypothetical protein
MVTPTKIFTDIEALSALVSELEPLFEPHGQIGVTARPGAEDPIYDAIGWTPEGAKAADYSEISPPFRGTVVEELLNSLPVPYGRARLMLLKPKSCLSIHSDSGERYHVAVKTNPGSYLIEVENDGHGKFHHVPADGQVYLMDASRLHTAINSGRKPRIHLVVCSALDHLNESYNTKGRLQHVLGQG